jgi:catechol 2,3-dioxygenase-like lactoylglutathione lyase family enzyme
MNLKLEVVVIPVFDVDRAKRFYEEALGFRVDVDHSAVTYEKGLGSDVAAQRVIASCS